MTGMGASLRGGAFRADANAKLALQSSDEPWGLPDVSALSVNATARLKAVLLMMLSSLLRSCRHNNTAQPGAGMGMAQGAGRDHFKSPGNSNCVCVFVIFRIGMRCSVSSAYLRSARLPGPDPGSGSSDRVETQTLHVTGAARVFFFVPAARSSHDGWSRVVPSCVRQSPGANARVSAAVTSNYAPASPCPLAALTHPVVACADMS